MKAKGTVGALICFYRHVSFEYLGCPLNAAMYILCGPVPQNAGTPSLLFLQIFNLPIISNEVLVNVSSTKDYIKEPLF
jgi:hypothetical protein